jgi:dephospho-CoA kinase
MSNHTVIGITGRTGSGKSHACQWIVTNRSAVEHIDCDHIGHRVLEMPAIKPQLIAAFGDQIHVNNRIDRSVLGAIVFNDHDQLRQLNDIVHPVICTEVDAIIAATDCPLILIEGALIHQVGLEHRCHHTLCIDSPTEAILKRRPTAERILSKQPQPNDYINMCTHTIKNNASIALFEEKLSQLLDRLSL